MRTIIAQTNAPPYEVGNPEKAWALPGHFIGDEKDAEADAFARLILFPSHPNNRASFDGVLERLQIKTGDKDYAAFGSKARHMSYKHTFRSYLRQMRFVTREALTVVFKVGNEANELPLQPVSLADAMWEFLVHEQNRVEPNLRPIPDSLALEMGYFPSDILPYGIPDVREGLGFGVFVENRHFGVYRIWSRLLMLTKYTRYS